MLDPAGWNIPESGYPPGCPIGLQGTLVKRKEKMNEISSKRLYFRV